MQTHVFICVSMTVCVCVCVYGHKLSKYAAVPIPCREAADAEVYCAKRVNWIKAGI